MRPLNSLLIVLILVAFPAAAGEPTHWPNWRGPLLNGVSPDGDPPVEWSETKNVRFKVELVLSTYSAEPIPGKNSPV